MGTNTVRLDDDVYERIKSQKRNDETFSDAIERLTSEWSLLDFAEADPPVDADQHRRLLEQSEQADAEETAERLEELGVSVEE